MSDPLQEDKLDGEMFLKLRERIKTQKPTYELERLYSGGYIVMKCYPQYRTCVSDVYKTKLEAMNYILELENGNT